MSKLMMAVTDCEHIDYTQEREICEANGIGFVKYDLKDEAEAAEVLKEYTVVGNQYLKMTDSLMDKLPNLKVIVRYGMGVDNVDILAATRHGIKVCNVPDYSVQEVAAHAFAMFMALTRKLKVMDRSMARGTWNYELSMPIYRYCEVTVGVVGFGRIGRTLAKMIHDLGCKVKVTDVMFPADLSLADREKYAIPEWVELTTLEDILATCNAVSLHVPLSKENGGVIQKPQLEMMRSDAVLINVSRGGLINEADLYEALVSGTIAGAACDTFEKEPTPADNPLLQLDNFIATPHMAWYSEQASLDLKRKVAEECIRALKGEALRYQLNKSVQ